MEQGIGVFRKSAHDFRLLDTEGDDEVGCDEDTEGQCVVTVRFQDDGNVDDDEDVVVFDFNVGTFFRVQGGFQNIGGDFRDHGYELQIVGIRVYDVDP